MDVLFYRSGSGNESVREFLKGLAKQDKQVIGEDIKTVQYGWPIGMPVVGKRDNGLWEIRCGSALVAAIASPANRAEDGAPTGCLFSACRSGLLAAIGSPTSRAEDGAPAGCLFSACRSGLLAAIAVPNNCADSGAPAGGFPPMQ
jgi:hypothetical protein